MTIYFFWNRSYLTWIIHFAQARWMYSKPYRFRWQHCHVRLIFSITCPFRCRTATYWQWILDGRSREIATRKRRRFHQPVEVSVAIIVAVDRAQCTSMLDPAPRRTAPVRSITPLTGRRCETPLMSPEFTGRRPCLARLPLLEIWLVFISKLPCDMTRLDLLNNVVPGISNT